MKSLIKIFALLIVWSSGVWVTQQEASAQQGYVSFRVFYDDLNPYGMWVDYPNYGYVWIPNADPGFSPYATEGQWVFTDDGWTWVSDYPWGWAPFHYGRWDYDNTYGWFWVPDGEWGPAWVSWRRSPGYYGWAPLRPGISINIAFGREYHERDERWRFVRDRDFGRSDMGRHFVDRSNNVTIINNSTVIVNTRQDTRRNATYIAGPDRDEVQRFTQAPVKAIAIREADKPGHRLSGSELQIYRPQVQKRNDNGQDPPPPKVVRLKDVKPISERNAGKQQQQPPAVTPPDKRPETQPRDANPSDKRREQQPPTVKPPDRGQPTQPRDANPSDKGREQQPPTVNSPDKGQPSQPRGANPSDKGKQQQPPTVKPPDKGQPSQPRGANPSDKGRQQQPPTVRPSDKGQPSQPRNVNPPNRQKQPQNVTPDKNRRAQPSQPGTNQDDKGKKKREDEKKPGR